MRRSHRRPLCSTPFALALVVFACVAPALASDAREVRLYTNADLERFPVLPDSAVRATAPDGDEWAVVVDYLERQYSRIDADRAYEIRRNQSEAEVESIRREAGRQRYSLPFGAWDFRGVPRRADVESGRGRFGRGETSSLGHGGTIRPLHAGPTRAQIDYHKATKRSGADAFPARYRPAGSASTPTPRRTKGR